MAEPVPTPAANECKPGRKPKPRPGTTPPPAATGQPIGNSEQYRILLAYADGTYLVDIARDQNLPLDYVTGVVRSLAGADRAAARELVVAYERGNSAAAPVVRGDAADEPGGVVTSGTVAEQTGLSFRQIDYWCRIGYLRPIAVGGSGARRFFDPDELRVATIMARLTAAGIVPDAAQRVARGETELAPGVRVLVDEPAGGGV